MSAPELGETVFAGGYIVSEPPLTEGMRSLRSLCQSIASAHASTHWVGHGFRDREIDGIDPGVVRDQIAEVVGNLLTPEGAELSVEHYHGQRVSLRPFVNSRLSHVSVGFSNGEVPKRRIVASHHSQTLSRLENVKIDPIDDERILITWPRGRYMSSDWKGHIALSFWHQKDVETRDYYSEGEPLQLAERIELWGSENERTVNPLIVAKVSTPRWGGGDVGIYEIPEMAPRVASDQEAIGFLDITRQIMPESWTRYEHS